MTYDYAYGKRWRLERSRGINRTQDVEPVRFHILSLRGAGWSVRSIAGAAGVSPTTISLLSAGKQQRVSNTIAEKVLAVDPKVLPSIVPRSNRRDGKPAHHEVNVPGVGTRRRLRALMRIGWPPVELSARLGKDPHFVYNKLHQPGSWVRRSTHDAVAALYRELCMIPGPSERTRRAAEKRGYPGPIDWDNIDLDEAPETERFTDEELSGCTKEDPAA